MADPEPRTPLTRRSSMPASSTAIELPECTPPSSGAPKISCFPRPPKRAISSGSASSPGTALPILGDASSAPLVTPGRREREYGKFDSPFIPDIHPTPIRRKRRAPIRRHSAIPLTPERAASPGDGPLISDKKYRAQLKEHTAWLIVTEGTLSSSPGIKIEEVADEDSDEEDRENFQEWCKGERRKRRLVERREMQRMMEMKELERKGEDRGEESGEDDGAEGNKEVESKIMSS
ncbi:hypothetical protein DFP73DRAFT_524678 [Morchella snyderi]|nr:hypothetical protein DFP73DRAFT_524678 [Morchella snyderi]